MKRFLIALVAIPCLSATIVFSIYESLNITQTDAKLCLLTSIGTGLLDEGNHDLVTNARKLPAELKVSGIRELIQLAKEYTATEEFKNDYKKWRNKQLNPDSKGKLGIPKFGKMLENKIDN